MAADTANLGELTLTRIYQAPPALLFEVMTTPEHLAHFWGPTGVSTPLANIIVEPRPGGRFETIMVNDETGDEYPMVARFVEFDPPHRLSWTDPSSDGGMTSSIDFKDLGDGRTEATVYQTNVPEMMMGPEARAGLESSFVKCDVYLATLQ